METIVRSLRLRVAIALAAVVALVAASVFAVLALMRTLDDDHRELMFAAAARFEQARLLGTSLSNRTRDGRGYLLSGDREFLATRAAARAEFDRYLAALATGEHAARFGNLRAQLARYDAISDTVIALHERSPEAALALWNTDSRAAQIELETELATVIADEHTRFAAARTDVTERSRSAWSRTMWAGIAVVSVLVLLLAIMARMTRDLLARTREGQQREMFELLEQVPVGIYVMTSDAKPFYVNRTAKAMLGERVDYELAKVTQAYQIFEVGTDQPYAAERLPIARALQGESVEASDLELRHTGDRVPLHVRAAPVNIDGNTAFAVAAFQDIRELRRIANTDVLTGLPNRTELKDRFLRRRLLAERAGYPLALAIIDLDRFKSINDTHGHAAGDEVLRRTAAVLTAQLRRTDDIGRWGGEEIVVLLSNTSLAGGIAALEKTLAAVRAERFESGAQTFGVTFSAGVVLVEKGEGIAGAVARADAHLYAAKSAGRDRVLG